MSFTHVAAGVQEHQHDTVSEAVSCEDEIAEVRAELAAENAYLTWAEFDPEELTYPSHLSMGTRV